MVIRLRIEPERNVSLLRARAFWFVSINTVRLLILEKHPMKKCPYVG